MTHRSATMTSTSIPVNPGKGDTPAALLHHADQKSKVIADSKTDETTVGKSGIPQSELPSSDGALKEAPEKQSEAKHDTADEDEVVPSNHDPEGTAADTDRPTTAEEGYTEPTVLPVTSRHASPFNTVFVLDTSGGEITSDVTQASAIMFPHGTIKEVVQYTPQNIQETMDLAAGLVSLHPSFIRVGLIVFDTAEGAESADHAFGYKANGKSQGHVAVRRVMDTTGYRFAHDNQDNIFVKGLPPDFKEKELLDFFSRYGQVISSRFLRGMGKATTIGALVRFSTPRQAAKAVKYTHETSPPRGNSQLVVRIADSPWEKIIKQQQRRASSASLASTKKYPNGLNPGNNATSPQTSASTTSSHQAGSPTGNGTSVLLGSPHTSPMLYPQNVSQPFVATQQPTEWAYYSATPYFHAGGSPQMHAPQLLVPQHPQLVPVNGGHAQMVNMYPSMVTQGYSDNQGHMAYGQPIAMVGSPTSPASTGMTNLYVNNLPDDADELFMYRLFAPMGAISSVVVIQDEDTGKCKGYGFVKFIKDCDAQLAIDKVSGMIIQDKPIQVSHKSRR